jgi:hypothetical protein
MISVLRLLMLMLLIYIICMLCVLGGWISNSNVVYFRSMYLRLISRCGAVSSGVTGNVTSQAPMNMMQAFSTYLPPDAFEEDASASPFEDSPHPA